MATAQQVLSHPSVDYLERQIAQVEADRALLAGIPTPEEDAKLEELRAQLELAGNGAASEHEEIANWAASPILRCVNDVGPERVNWLWPAYLPSGKLVILDGDPALGKSTLTLDLAARISSGAEMPDGFALAGPRGIVLLTAEDGIADCVRPRLEAAGADLNRIFVLDAVAREDGSTSPPSLPSDVSLVREAVDKVDASLVIIDPFAAYLHPSVNSHRDQDVRGAMRPMTALAEETGSTVLLVRHLNKTPSSNPLYRGGGSIGLLAVARVGLLLAKDPEQPERRIMAVTKSNLARMAPSVAFRLLSDEQRDCARVEWEGTTGHTAMELLAPDQDHDAKTLLDEAVEFLQAELSEGPRLANELKRAAKDQAGIAQRTLERARKPAGVRSKRNGFGPGGTNVWYLDPAHARHQLSMDAMFANPQRMADMASMDLPVASMGRASSEAGPPEILSTAAAPDDEWPNQGTANGQQRQSQKP